MERLTKSAASHSATTYSQAAPGPELKEVQAAWIHQSWLSPKPPTYPAPVVDHAEARARAMSLYFRWKKR